MPDARYPTLEEFWRRLDVRKTEDDLRDSLRQRLEREERAVERLGPEALVVAVAERLLPGAVPPRALAAFLDEVFDRQLGRGDEQDGLMPREELIPTGFRVLDEEARRAHGRPFADLEPERQDELLGRAEKGDLQGPDRFDSSQWFKRTFQFLLLGFGSDPRGMVQMGFPGPSYRSGHIWLDEREVAARTKRRRGYLEL